MGLASLLTRFRGKVQTIYIDPPFNTKRDDFAYNDRFTRSTWLTFMRNRLLLAFDLCATTATSSSRSRRQYPYLAVLANEIFDEANYVETIVWSYGTPSGGRAAGTKPVGIHEYILHFAKNRPNRFARKVFTDYSEKYIEDRFTFVDLADGRRYRTRERADGSVQHQYLDESRGVPLSTVWSDIETEPGADVDTEGEQGAEAVADPPGTVVRHKPIYAQHLVKRRQEETGFGTTQKPERLIKRIIEHSTRPDDLVLDFFGGSGTTAATAHKMGRRWITVEQLEDHVRIAIERLTNVVKGEDIGGITKDDDVNWAGGGSFVACELMKLNQGKVERVMAAKTTDGLLAIWNEVRATGLVSYRVVPELFDTDAFNALGFDDQQRAIIGTLDKNQLYVNFHDIEDADYEVAEDDKKFNRTFYRVQFGSPGA